MKKNMLQESSAEIQRDGASLTFSLRLFLSSFSIADEVWFSPQLAEALNGALRVATPTLFLNLSACLHELLILIIYFTVWDYKVWHFNFSGIQSKFEYQEKSNVLVSFCSSLRKRGEVCHREDVAILKMSQCFQYPSMRCQRKELWQFVPQTYKCCLHFFLFLSIVKVLIHYFILWP